MGDPLLKTEGLVRDYHVGSQAVRALGGVSVEVERGEFVAVMGPSGSGKSTYMNLLGCLDKPTAGRYILDGDDVSSLSNLKQLKKLDLRGCNQVPNKQVQGLKKALPSCQIQT